MPAVKPGLNDLKENTMVTKKLKGLGRGLEALVGPTAQGSAALALTMPNDAKAEEEGERWER